MDNMFAGLWIGLTVLFTAVALFWVNWDEKNPRRLAKIRVQIDKRQQVPSQSSDEENVETRPVLAWLFIGSILILLLVKIINFL